MAGYNDLLSGLPPAEYAEATKFVATHSEHGGIGRVTDDPELACPGDMNSGDLMTTFIRFLCACGKKLNLDITS